MPRTYLDLFILAKNFFKTKYLAIFICFSFFVVSFFVANSFNLKNLKYSGNSVTSDEIPHITSGFYYLKTGKYFLNPEHPPLVKDISAILPYFILNPTFSNVLEREKENPQWDGQILIFNPKNNPDLIILLSRLSVIIFNSVFLFILYILLEKSWNKRSALISISLIAFSQFNIAHASLVTTDFMASVLSMSALAAFSIYIKKFLSEERTFAWMIFSVLFFSLSFIAKFSTLMLVPAAFLGGLIYCIITTNNRKKILSYIERFVIMLLMSLCLVFSFYSFHVINSDSDGIKSQLQKNYPQKLPVYGKEFLTKMAEGNRFERAIATYGVGLSMTINRIESAGQATYFLKKIYRSEGAGYKYFPILYLTKLPLPFLITEALLLFLVIISIYVLILQIIRKKIKIKKIFDELNKISPLSMLLVVFVVIYAKEALTNRLNIGLRHFMPVIIASSLITARGAQIYWNKKIYKDFKTKYAILVLLAIMTISVFISFPHYLSYYNIFGGGTDNGYKIATDSNYDWGQDIKRLGKWIDDNNVDKIHTHLFSANKLDYYLNNKYQSFNIEHDNLPSSGSYLAVSAQELQNNIYNQNLPEDKKYSQLKNSLVARVGKSIFIFKIP